MLDRIRRKLFLSLKVIGSADVSSSENSSFGRNELLDILRRGSSALSTDNGEMTLAKFLKAPIEDILEVSRKMDKIKDTKIKSEFPVDEVDNARTEQGLDAGIDQQALRDVEEEEMRLLKGVALVQSRLFEGKVVQRGTNKDIAMAWEDVQKRARVDSLVMVDDLQVTADHIAPLAVTILCSSVMRLKVTELW
jgi:SWI/SNF-related matrix-associated actin-dependent regulator of chromatin subfamily A member 5